MKKTTLERNTVVVLFILVLVVFSFAERDSKKLDTLYMNTGAASFEPLKKQKQELTFTGFKLDVITRN